jgi:hypothetical protein
MRRAWPFLPSCCSPPTKCSNKHAAIIYRNNVSNTDCCGVAQLYLLICVNLVLQKSWKPQPRCGKAHMGTRGLATPQAFSRGHVGNRTWLKSVFTESASRCVAVAQWQMPVMPRGCEREGGECSNLPTAPIAKNTTISLACSRSWQLKLLSMPARWIDPAGRIGSPRGEAAGFGRPRKRLRQWGDNLSSAQQ